MQKENLEKWFGRTIGTVFGSCYVEGYSDDKTHIILREHGEPFAFTIDDFMSQLKTYNSVV